LASEGYQRIVGELGELGELGFSVTLALGSARATPFAEKLVVLGLKREYARPKAVIGRYCSNLSRRPSAGKICLSLTSRAVSSKATETPFTSMACLDFGGLGGG
jgi:hypothetical protein